MGLIDKTCFERRGRKGCSDSHYLLHRTTCCGAYCVEDSELHDLYIDADNLENTIQLYYDSPCPLCGAADWELAEIIEPSVVPQKWAWAMQA